MPRRFAAAVLAVALAACSSRSKPPEPPRQVQLTARIGSFEIANGVRGVVAADPESQTATVVMRLAVGSSADPEGKAGLAHLAEHIVYQIEVGGRTLISRLAEVALLYNAETSYDYTAFYAVAPTDQLGRVLEIHAAFLGQGCRGLSPEAFAREREVVRNEIRAGRSGRGGDLPQILSEAAFPAGHPYRRTIGGDDEQLVSITQEDVCQFLDRHYTGDAVVLALTGGITDQQIGAALNVSFARVPKLEGATVPAPAELPADRLGKRLSSKTDIDLPYAVVLFRMPPEGTPERIAADMVYAYAASRAGGFADTYEFATGVYPLTLGGDAASLAGVAIQLRESEDAREAIDAVWKAFGKADDYLGELDFEHSKAVQQYRLVRRFDVPLSRAKALATYHQQGRLEYFFGDLDQIRSLDRDRARRAAGRVFRRENAVAIVIEPDGAAEKRYRRAAPSLTSAGTHEGNVTVEVDPSQASRPMELPVAALDAYARELTLDNGMRVILAPRSSAPVVQIHLILSAGRSAEPEGRSGIATIATDFLGVKLDATSDVEIRAALQFYRHGGLFGASASDDFTTFSASGLAMYVDHLLAGLERRIRTGPYDQQAIERFVGAQKVALATPGSRESLIAAQTLYAKTFGDEHPYATRGFWLESDLGNLGRDAANDFRSRHYVGANATLIVSGKFDPDLVEQHVRYHFGEWPAGTETPPVSAPPQRRAGEKPLAVAVEGSNPELVEVNISFPLPAGIGEDYAELRIMEQMVMQQVGAIREEMGASYGFSASIDTNRGPGMLVIRGSVDAPRAGAALSELLAGLDRLRAGDGDFDGNFVIARRELARGLLADAESAGSVAGRLAFAARYRLPLDYHRRLATEVAGLTADRIRGTISRHLPARAARIILVGTRSNVEGAFTAAGFAAGEITRVE